MNVTNYLVPAISVIVAAAAFYFATRAAKGQSTAAIHAVDADAYTRASSIYEDTITNLRADITGLREDLSAARSEIRSLNEQITGLRRHFTNGSQ